MSNTVIIKNLGIRPYEATWQAMRDFTQHRDESTPDELWVLEHLPVFTQGQAGKPEHILNAGNIPIVQTDRGGQVTYHGPGQLVVYTLINLPRKQLSIRPLVRSLENAVIHFLAEYNILASARVDAPGVYVQDAKICSLGLRIRRGCSYHGISFNVNMDLTPFSRINPCGLKNLSVTQVSDLGGPDKLEEVANGLIPHLAKELGYTEIIK